MKNYIIIILLFASCLTAQQKSDQQYASYAYTLSKGLDLPLGTLIAALNIYALILKNNIKPLTIEEINQLNTSDIWKFERKLTENWDRKANTVSHMFLYSSICNPALLYLQKDIRKDVFGWDKLDEKDLQNELNLM